MSLVCFLLMMYAPDYEVVKTFKQPPADSENYVAFPYGVDFAPDGKMFVTDGKNAQIHVWDKAGNYIKSFSRKGEGPGELSMPTSLDVTADRVYVWDFNRRIVWFSHDGEYLGQFHLPNARPGRFVVLNEELILVGYHHFGGPNDIAAVFEVIDHEGNGISEVMKIKSEWFLSPYEGGNKVRLKAFGPEVDIQRQGDRIFFGFSQNPVIYECDNSGQVIDKTVYRIPTEKPTDDEVAFLKAMTVIGPNGNRVSLSSFPDTDVDFGHDKAYWTHFILNNEHAAFILTPMGGTTSMGSAFYRASYMIADRKTHAYKDRGTYAFEEDSFVFHQDGRSVAFAVKGEEYEIKEIKLKGF